MRTTLIIMAIGGTAYLAYKLYLNRTALETYYQKNDASQAVLSMLGDDGFVYVNTATGAYQTHE